MLQHYPLNPTTGVEDPAQLPWTNGNPATGVEGSYPPFQLCVDPQTEILNLIAEAGIAPSELDLAQLMRGVRSGRLTYFQDTSGGANSLVITPTTAHTGYGTGGLEFRVKIANTNTGASTLNVNGLGAKTIVKQSGSPLAAGDLLVGAIVDLIFDGTNFRVNGLSPSDAGSGPASLVHYGVDVGAVNAIAANFSPVITSLVAGMLFEVTPLLANTSTTVTLNPSGLGAVNCFRSDGSALVIGDIQPAPAKAVFVYDATSNKMLMIDPDIAVSQGSVPFPGLPINGLIPSAIAGTSTTASMTTSSGGCSNNLGTQSIISPTSINWSVANGNAANGYQGGSTLPNSTTIYMYLIWGTAGIATFASTGLNTPTLPSGYQYFRLIHAFYTNSSGAPVPYTAYEGPGGGLNCGLVTPVFDINGALLPTVSRTLYTLSLPLGLVLEWHGRATGASTSSGADIACIITSANDPDVTPTSTGTNSVIDIEAASSGSVGLYGKSNVVTDVLARVGARASGNFTLYLTTMGWLFYRRI